jgi:DNA-binding NarL/FixJ family response regulator
MPEGITTVLLVEDHTLVRRAFRRLLEDEPDLRVIGEARDGHEAVEAVRQLRPDVVVMDFALPSMNGGVATERILKIVPNTAVLILSMHSEPNYVRTSLDAGARGYLLKSTHNLELGQAVREVAAGGRVIDSQIVLPAHSADNTVRPLTPRELAVLELVVHGKSNEEIGKALGISSRTVAVHRLHIMDALGVHNTASLVLYAVGKGLVNIS